MEAGLAVAQYRVVSRLGSGGMGEVFLAYDTKLDRHVALKILSRRFATDPSRLRRFTLEARTIASLNHPNIAHVYDLGESEGTCFIAMEYVDGQSLASRLAAGPCTIGEILSIGIQIAEALAEAHEKGVVHRDIKPANVMLPNAAW
jgi:serine/threonine protein kinase